MVPVSQKKTMVAWYSTSVLYWKWSVTLAVDKKMASPEPDFHNDAVVALLLLNGQAIESKGN